MKIIAILLAILCAILVTAMVRQGGSTTAALETVVKSRDTFSNQVDVVTTKLMEEHGTTAFARSNLQSVLDRRTSDAHFFSNRVVQTLLRLSDAQREARTGQIDLQNNAMRLASMEAQREECSRRLELIPALQKELLEAKVQLGQATRDREDLEQSLGRSRLEVATLERTLDDPVLLEFQLRKSEDAAHLRKATAAGRRVELTNPRLPLEWQPDGTVRALAGTNGVAKK